MKTKQEQIEDIQKILPNIEVVKAMYGDFDLAELLYDRRCRKISKNIESIWNKYNIKIDMLEKINTNLQELNENYYNEAIYLRQELKQARNETAKEILDELLKEENLENVYFTDENGNIRNRQMIRIEKIKDIVKKYSVEVEE